MEDAAGTETIVTTTDHPFYTAEGEWIEAGDLLIGDSIATLHGTGIVTASETEYRTTTMYDLTVDEAHTFAVGQGAWVVHNCDIPNNPTKIYDDEGLSGIAREYRRNNPDYGAGRNVVVYEWLDPENGLMQEAFPMRPFRNQAGPTDWTFHSEQWGWNLLQERGVKPHQVTAIYSEIKPCSGSSGSCDPFLRQIFTQEITVEYSFTSDDSLRNAVIKDPSLP